MTKKDQNNIARLVLEMYDSGTISHGSDITKEEEQDVVNFIRSRILPKKVDEWNKKIEYYKKDKLSRLSRIWSSKQPTSLQEVEENLVKMGDNDEYDEYDERKIKYMVDLRPQNSILLDMSIVKDGDGQLGVSVSDFDSTSSRFYRV